jgi:hypothetical protein
MKLDSFDLNSMFKAKKELLMLQKSVTNVHERNLTRTFVSESYKNLILITYKIKVLSRFNQASFPLQSNSLCRDNARKVSVN